MTAETETTSQIGLQMPTGEIVWERVEVNGQVYDLTRHASLNELAQKLDNLATAIGMGSILDQYHLVHRVVTVIYADHTTNRPLSAL